MREKIVKTVSFFFLGIIFTAGVHLSVFCLTTRVLDTFPLPIQMMLKLGLPVLLVLFWISDFSKLQLFAKLGFSKEISLEEYKAITELWTTSTFFGSLFVAGTLIVCSIGANKQTATSLQIVSSYSFPFLAAMALGFVVSTLVRYFREKDKVFEK